MKLTDFRTLTPIDYGWSGDRKYRAVTADGTPYFLRVTSRERGGRFVKLFDLQKTVAATGIPMCQPVAVGECDEGVYAIHSWIDGVDAEATVPTLPTEVQYRLGRDAGAYLTRIHSIPAPPDQPDWEARFNAKINRKIKMYADCPIHFEGDRHLLRYIEENRYLLRNRPQTFQHGDYHTGNMMIDANGTLTVIDFDRDDYGDPWEEFNRIVWCAQLSPAFASGLVDGYFDGPVPLEFWQLLALYISSNTLSSLPWAIPYGEGEIHVMRNQAAEILTWYDHFCTVIPSWYHKEERL